MILRLFQKNPAFALLFLVAFVACKKNDPIVTPKNDEIVKTGNLNLNEILGRPTNTSVTINILFDQPEEVYWEIGTSSGVYKLKTNIYTSLKGVPTLADFTNLSQNTKYYYRTRYRTSGSNDQFVAGAEHTFHTQRNQGESFVFTVESDPHPYDKKGCHNLWLLTLQNQLKDNPDFMFDLGDTFGDDHNASTITSDEVKQLHLNDRAYFGAVCHSMPLFFCLGNHEGESGYYLLQSPPDNLAVYGNIWRNYYYPNPYPDGFYTGNLMIEGNPVGKPENYYSWKWGDALFVVIDVYRYASSGEKPEKWDFTLGKVQYDWLKSTLENTSSKYKFVFAHHVRGQGRGGITNAKFYEWGGYEENNNSYTFDTNRPGWGKPIQQLFKDNHVNIFFQGHDHLFAHEVLDGITYQEVPMPGDSTYILGKTANGAAYTSDVIDGSGYIRVTVSPLNIKTEYIQSYLPKDENGTQKNRMTSFSYTLN